METTLARRTEFVADLRNLEVRDSGDPATAYTISGHAAVYDSLSLDLGGFREKIDPGAFDNCLARGPAVLAVWDHDTRWVLGNTANDTLELSVDEVGLRFFARVPRTDYAAELKVLLEGRYVSQCSFMFTIERERYEVIGEGEREMVVFTIEEIGELYDVCVTGRGAYPQTDVALSRKARFEAAVRELQGESLADEAGVDPENPTAPVADAADESESVESVEEDEAGGTPAHAVEVEQAKRRRAVAPKRG